MKFFNIFLHEAFSGISTTVAFLAVLLRKAVLNGL